MRILFFGDIVGKLGRRAVTKALPDLVNKHRPDVIFANGENLAHGVGFTESTLQEMERAGIQFFTSGNHVLDKPEAKQILAMPDARVIRPANYPPGLPGQGYRLCDVNGRQILLINLMGRVFMKENLDCPFRAFDAIIKRFEGTKLAGVVVDFHGEATSEKVAFGHYVDGRASLVVGTHTHIPTADQKILPDGCAYVTDLGMSGLRYSVIGVEKAPVIAGFLSQTSQRFVIPDAGEADVDAVLVDIDPVTRRATAIARVDSVVTI